MKVATGIMTICLTTPIWLYLIYKIMVLVNATELMWFLFWVYVPAVIIVACLKTAIDNTD